MWTADGTQLRVLSGRCYYALWKAADRGGAQSRPHGLQRRAEGELSNASSGGRRISAERSSMCMSQRGCLCCWLLARGSWMLAILARRTQGMKVA